MAENQKMPETGPAGRNLIAAVRELREQRGLSYRKLSAALGEAGRPVFPLGLSRLERGERRADVDDLVALAIVLGVNPSALLLPRDASPEDQVELTSAVSVRARFAWQWADGRMPLPAKDPGEGQPASIPDADLADFAEHARPRLSAHRDHPAVREAENLRARLLMALEKISDGSAGEDTRDWWAAYVRRALKRAEIEIDELFDAGA